MPLGISDDLEDQDGDTRDAARRTWIGLTAFRRDCLVTIQSFNVTGHAPKGLAVLDTLVAERGEEINHGHLYTNLNELADMGLVEVGTKDNRTNEYSLTEHGRRVLRAGARRFATIDGGAGDE